MHTHQFRVDQRVIGKSESGRQLREVFAWCRCGVHLSSNQINEVLNRVTQYTLTDEQDMKVHNQHET